MTAVREAKPPVSYQKSSECSDADIGFVDQLPVSQSVITAKTVAYMSVT